MSIKNCIASERLRVVILLSIVHYTLWPTCAIASEPDARVVVEQVVKAAGGSDKLLKLFRTRETVNVSSDPAKIAPERISVYEPPNYWWTGKKERVGNPKEPQEPATFLVWGWTLGALCDAESKLESLPEIEESSRPAFGLRISGTISPAMDIYFDKSTSQLVRIDWRSDILRFSDWKEHDGVKYPAKCIGYKKATGNPWYFSEIVELERLHELPDGLERR